MTGDPDSRCAFTTAARCIRNVASFRALARELPEVGCQGFLRRRQDGIARARGPCGEGGPGPSIGPARVGRCRLLQGVGHGAGVGGGQPVLLLQAGDPVGIVRGSILYPDFGPRQ